MSPTTQPRYPIFIPSKSRAEIAYTPRFLDQIRVPYRLIVEEQQADEYARHFPRDRLLILDPQFQAHYATLDDLGTTKSLGPGPARNYAWALAIAEGHPWHWVMDDNIIMFHRFHQNRRSPVGDGTCFHAMETFATRYRNVGMAGPNYFMFAPSRQRKPKPYMTGTRIYSCNLIRTSLPFRWRGRYNEDTILSLDMLKAGWNTIQFHAFLQEKKATQRMRGGNTEAFYAREGTRPKTVMLRDAHPDLVRIVWRFNRWHHHVNYSSFAKLPLTPDPNHNPDDDPTYNLKTIPRTPARKRRG